MVRLSRDVKAEEIFHLISNHSGAGLSPWTLEQIRDHFKGSGGVVGLRGPEGELLAFVLFRRIMNEVELLLLATHGDFRRCGYMRRLLELVEPDWEGVGAFLEVHEGNLAARRLYESVGFQRVGSRPAYYRDGGDALLYRRLTSSQKKIRVGIPTT